MTFAIKNMKGCVQYVLTGLQLNNMITKCNIHRYYVHCIDMAKSLQKIIILFLVQAMYRIQSPYFAGSTYRKKQKYKSATWKPKNDGGVKSDLAVLEMQESQSAIKSHRVGS